MEGRTEGFQFSPETLRSFSRYYREHPTESVIDGYEKNSSGKIIRRANEKAMGRNLFLLLFFIMFILQRMLYEDNLNLKSGMRYLYDMLRMQMKVFH